ncbi:MAG: TetR/AcrR family transcriptional regulator [Gulosibacter sp.]|uniref:TetR/AcrR family transcriptional regulator n=1 Tax=Gulosibacter sp. TaxID=2817531 RepID=UPI003F923652
MDNDVIPPPFEMVRTAARKSQDPRALATQGKILDAVRDLGRSGATSISVADILRASGVSKTTFYSHYEDMSDLALQIFTASVAELRGDASDGPIAVERIIDHYGEHRALYRAALIGRFRSIIKAQAIDVFARYLSGAESPDAATRIAAAAIMGALDAWLRDELEVTREELATTLRRMI